jgi:hypothetical protein
VYNVVLSTGHVIVINGLRFITLGHGIDSHPVLAHAFFGTQVSGVFWGGLHQRVTLDPGRCSRHDSERQWPRRGHGARRCQVRFAISCTCTADIRHFSLTRLQG